MGVRRQGRECALQMLFQWDLTHDPIDEISLNFREVQKASPDARDFADQLLKRTVQCVKDIDQIIERHAENWRLNRMATVDRNILRLVTQELLYDKETPNTVVINEAIEIARRFGAQQSPNFVNGVLDSIRKELEE